MSLRRLPLWLVCDVIAFAGMMLSFWAWHRVWMDAFGRMMARGLRKLDPEEFSLCCALLAAAEAAQRFAITRHAFRLAGLAPGDVVFFEPSLATRPRAYARRSRAYCDRALTLDACARRLAERLKRTLAAKPSMIMPLDDSLEPVAAPRRAPAFVSVRLHPAARGPPARENVDMDLRSPGKPCLRGRSYFSPAP